MLTDVLGIMSAPAVAAWERVPAGAQIGLVGNTGLSSGAHLHWDIRVNNVPVNPLQWLSDWVP